MLVGKRPADVLRRIEITGRGLRFIERRLHHLSDDICNPADGIRIRNARTDFIRFCVIFIQRRIGSEQTKGI